MKYIGNSLETTGWRIYKSIHRDNTHKRVLVSWIDLKCENCGKYFKKESKTQRKLCRKCAKKRQYERQNEWRNKTKYLVGWRERNREKLRLYKIKYRYLRKLNK